MRDRQRFSFILFILVICLLISDLFPVAVMAEESICARVKIEIRQEATFERQAFDAHMQINNGLTTISLENVLVDVLFSTEAGDPVRASSNPDDANALFFIRVQSMDGIADVKGNGSVAPATTADIHWLIVPAPASVANAPTGKLYFVGAKLTYSLGGEEHVTEVTPDYITVRPLPLLQLDYFLPDEVYGDDPFTQEEEPSVPFSLGIRITNNGQGTANKFKINSAQPKIVENDQGLLVDFLIEGSEVNGVASPDTLLIEFGDIAPGTSTLGRWQMTCSLSGRFVEFNAEYSHADDLGGELTSLIDNINTHFLVQDVLVDIAGRDAIRDFLGRDGDVYNVYESDAGVSEAIDLSSEVQLTLVQDVGGEAIYDVKVPPSAGFSYLRFNDPQAGTKIISTIVRSDGKTIKKENGWLSGKRVDATWSYFANIFDYNSSGAYTITFIDSSLAPKPPEFDTQEDPVHKEGEELTFLIQLEGSGASQERMQILQMTDKATAMSTAAAADNRASSSNVTISVDRLPVGAEFIDLGNGMAILRWTPQAGQAGDYPLTFIASDGDTSTTIRYHLLITDLKNKPVSHFVASPTSGAAPLEVQFSDESQSVDGISSLHWDFGDGSTSTVQNPKHSYDTAGEFYPSLTVTEIDGDEHSYTAADPILVESDSAHPHLETGHIVVDHDWQNVQLKGTFIDPVVIASIYDARAMEPASVRIKQIAPKGFQIRLEEGLYADGVHEAEEVAYIVMERGRYTLQNGKIIVADSLTSSAKKTFTRYSFPKAFKVPPVVVGTVTSVHDTTPANLAFRNIGTTGLYYLLQPEEAITLPHGSERIDFIAWEPSTGLMGANLFEVGRLAKTNNTWQEYKFSEHFNTSPVLVATRQTANDHDPATVLCRHISFAGLEVRIAEDTSADRETHHSKEIVGYIALTRLSKDVDSDEDGISDTDERSVYGTHPGKKDSDGDGIDDGTELAYWGSSWSTDIDKDRISNLLDKDSDGDGFFDGLENIHNFNPADPKDFPHGPIMETETVTVDHNWQIVKFSTTFIDPIVVGTVTGASDVVPANVRIKNIETTGFMIRLEEGLYTDGNHSPEEVSYIVMERARYTLPNGKTVIADRTESSHSGGFVKYRFQKRFKIAPVVVGNLTSTNDSTPANIVFRGINRVGFDFFLAPEEAITSPHGRERVDFIAWEPGAGLIDNHLVHVGYFNDVDDTWRPYSFKEHFSITPSLVAARQTFKGTEPVTVLCRTLSTTGVEVRVAEDTSADTETTHPKEKIGFIAIDGNYE